jgi:glycosyltransferase involved in cell wall biosynthesis
MSVPRVSICIPNYNMGKYLRLAVGSALAQTYDSYEVVVCDNASTDDSMDVLASLKNPRLRVIRNDANIGMIANFNKVIEQAKAPFIKLLEADDLLEPECLREMMAAAERHPDAGIIACSMVVMNAKSEIVSSHIHAEEVVSGGVMKSRVHSRGNEVGTPTHVLLRRALLDKTGLFDPDYRDYLNDFDLWIRCFDHTNVAFLSAPLIRVRRHAEQVGAIGSKNNREIDVAHLMFRKRWAHPRPLSFEFWQKTRMILDYNERWLWIGARRFFIQKEPAPPRHEFFVKVCRNSGPLYGVASLIYWIVRAPWVFSRYVARGRA